MLGVDLGTRERQDIWISHFRDFKKEYQTQHLPFRFCFSSPVQQQGSRSREKTGTRTEKTAEVQGKGRWIPVGMRRRVG